VDDLVEGMIRMMGRDDFIGPVNLGNPEERSILDFARIILQLTGSDSPIDFQPLPADDPTQRQPDVALAGKMLDWQPRVILEEGLKRTIEYFRQKLTSSGTSPTSAAVS
jgi:nucleoside-diphosphate-sugar epimerase